MTANGDGRAGVLCAGSIIVDVGKIIDRYPEPEHLATIEHVSSSTGGPALNMAVDLRMLGADWPVAVAGAIGDDENGAFVLAECEGHRVDSSGVCTIDGAATAFTDAMVEADGGRRTFFHHSGANSLFDGAQTDVESSTARILHVGAPGIHPLMDEDVPGDGNGWSALLARGRAAGLRTNLELVSIDPDRVAELARPCLPLLDSLVVNELEASAVSGIDVTPSGADGAVDWECLERIALELVALGVSTLAVVHFPAGCVAAAPGNRTWRQGSVRVPRDQVRSTTGAGDAFAAGALFGLHENWSVERCLELGVAAAGMSVRSPHTSAGIAPATACLAAAARDGHRSTGSDG
jgi:sugar/nucleoside kinase (ribokinase family)